VASGNVTITFQLIDREKEPGNIILEYSTDSGVSFKTATLVDYSETQNLESDWYPGITHTVCWNSPVDMVGRSGNASVIVKVTPSDATNPSGGSSGVSRTFTVNNIAYNTPPTVALSELSGVKLGNIRADYSLIDIESDTCSIEAEYSTDAGVAWNSATKGAVGEGLSGLSSSPSGTAHIFFWNSRADGVGIGAVADNVMIRITPGDFHTGTAGEAGPFSVDNTVPNSPPTVAIASGPEEGSTVYTDQVTFAWTGSDTDGIVIGYYYSFDRDPPDVWTTNTSVTSGNLLNGPHTFRIVAVDDYNASSDVASRTFNILVLPPPAKVANPVPAGGAINVPLTQVLSWNAASGADSYDIYFGTDQTAVANATRASPEFKGNQTGLSYDPPDDLSYSATYYWLIDSVNIIWTTKGDIWSFATVPPPPPGYCWTHRIGAGSYDQGTDVFADASGNVYVVGGFDGTVNFAEDWGGSDTKVGGGAFVTKIDAGGNHLWTHRIGGYSGNAICADRTGNIYVAGYFGGTVNFAADWGGSDTKSSAGYADVFVTKIDSGGNYCWTHRMGGSTYNDEAYAVCTDGDGNIYVAGDFYGSVNFAADWGSTDTKISTTGWDIFITKMDTSGNYLWTRRMGGTGDFESAYALCTDVGGNVYVAGYFYSPTVNFAEDWGESDIKVSAGNYDIFITEINANGSYGWTRRIGSTDVDAALGLCTDAGGAVYVAGIFRGAVNFAADWGGTDARMTAGGGDVFITKIDTTGNYGWTRRMGGGGDDYANAVYTDEIGNLYLAGAFSGASTNFAEDWGGTDNKTSSGGSDIFVTRINSSGTYGWTRRMGGADSDIAYAICPDESGNVYVAGYFYRTVNFAADWGGTDTKTSAGETDIFITKIRQ
jgi:hypothetical protein